MLKLALEAGLGDSLNAQQEASVYVIDSAFSGGARRSTTYRMSDPPESSITAGPGVEQVLIGRAPERRSLSLLGRYFHWASNSNWLFSDAV